MISAAARNSGRRSARDWRWASSDAAVAGDVLAAPALLRGTPTLPIGMREFAADNTLDLPSLAGGAVHSSTWRCRALGSATAPSLGGLQSRGLALFSCACRQGAAGAGATR